MLRGSGRLQGYVGGYMYEDCCYPGITDFIVNSKNNCDKRNGKIIRGTVIRETAIRGTILRGTIITVMSTLKFGLSLVK